MLAWTTERFEAGEMGWPNVFYSASVARRFVRQFSLSTDGVVLVGIGPPEMFADEFVAEEEPSGVRQAVGQGKELEPGGEDLGFEVLGYEFGSFHSWLCNGLEEDAFKALGVRPSGWGLIRDLEEADRCADYASREDVGAEPVFWNPWLLKGYGLA